MGRRKYSYDNPLDLRTGTGKDVEIVTCILCGGKGTRGFDKKGPKRCTMCRGKKKIRTRK